MKSKFFNTLLVAIIFISSIALPKAVGQGDNAEPQKIEMSQDIKEDTGLIAQVDPGTEVQSDATADVPQNEQNSEEEDPKQSGFAALWEWIRNNTAEAILAFLAIVKIIVNLTPTETDNRWYDVLERMINSIFPNLRKGGGTHPKP